MSFHRTTLATVWAATVCIASLLAAFTTAVPTASARTLKIATVMPDGSAWLEEMREAASEITEKTEGRVKLKFYPGGVMGNDKTVLRKIRAGQLQGGAFTSGTLAAVFPDIELYSMPLLFRSYEEVDYVRERMDGKMRSGLEKAGFVALAVSDGGFAYLLSRNPIHKVEDLSGAKVWIVEDDVMSQIAFDIAGVAPVPLPLADVYTGLQTGLVDTVAAPPMGAIAFQWHTKVKYLTDVPLMYLTGILAVERRAFEKLTPPDRAVVMEIIGVANARLDTEGRKGDANAREALKNQGIEFVQASSEEEVLRWRNISSQAVSKLRTLGRYSEGSIGEILGHVEDFRAQSPAVQ